MFVDRLDSNHINTSLHIMCCELILSTILPASSQIKLSMLSEITTDNDDVLKKF